MINKSCLINDGLDANCLNNGQTTWTYNQGVILGGLIALKAATGDDEFLQQACCIADATTKYLVDKDGILEEATMINRDGVLFKGIFARYLGLLAKSQIETSNRDRYISFLKLNAASLLARDSSKEGLFGGFWQGPVNISCKDHPVLLASVQIISWNDTSAESKLRLQTTSAKFFDAKCASASTQISAVHLLNAASSIAEHTASPGFKQHARSNLTSDLLMV